jgi:hypothetical protein
MAEPPTQESLSNQVSEETGQFDPRFNLWRQFCADQGIAPDCLPGDLSAEAKAEWEKLKESELHRRDEVRRTDITTSVQPE